MNRFEELAILEFPEVIKTKQITRKQIVELQNKYGVGYPNYLANSQNAISRGVFRFEVDTESTNYVPEKTESDDEIYSRIQQSYDNLELLVDSVGNGVTTSMIVSGAPGIGKSHTISQVLDSNPLCNYTVIKGMVKATGIFKTLYENRHKNDIVVFDDSDEVFNNEISLNLLKAALELNQNRRLSWLSEKEFITEDGETIPKSFDYHGGIIFLTNLDFITLIDKGNKFSPHLQALESRTIYFDLGVRTCKELMIRIKQVAEKGNILAPYGISPAMEHALILYMEDNVQNLRELSIRTLQKLGSLSKASPWGWKELADQVLLKK